MADAQASPCAGPSPWRRAVAVGLGWGLLLAVPAACAQLSNDGLMDQVILQFAQKAQTWRDVMMAAATWLFWTLGTISLAWTAGTMVLRKADLGEFFAEFVRFILFFGFYLWLLRNGPEIAQAILASLQRLGQEAAQVRNASPSGIVDVGFLIWQQTIQGLKAWGFVDSLVGVILSACILLLLAAVAVQMLLVLISGWILMYAGIFFLGFGGSRWTSEMAIGYYKAVLGVAVRLLTMTLMAGIGQALLTQLHGRMNPAQANFEELGVMLVFCLALLMLVSQVPAMVAGIIAGGVGAGSGIGQWSAQNMQQAASSARAAGAALGGVALQGLGIGQAVLAAHRQAGRDGEDAGSSPGGLWGGSAGGAGLQAARQSSADGAQARMAAFQGGGAEGGGSQATSSGLASMSQSQGEPSAATPRPQGAAARLGGAARHLARGSMAVVRARVRETPGGQIAAAIESAARPVAPEVAAFVQRDSSPGG